ncbi:hypothetical protein, partial [Piscirickettsia salmonis]|uniref:hypothetical protein n=1 Tax=Piscirickettsia salmonis TaxID=1238 RepID=UPI00055DC1D2
LATDLTVSRNSALLKTRTYLGLLTPCLALHGSQRMNKHVLPFYNLALKQSDSEPLYLKV